MMILFVAVNESYWLCQMCNLVYFRSALYKVVTSEMTDLSVLQVAEVYKDFTGSGPLVSTIDDGCPWKVLWWILPLVKPHDY